MPMDQSHLRADGKSTVRLTANRGAHAQMARTICAFCENNGGYTYEACVLRLKCAYVPGAWLRRALTEGVIIPTPEERTTQRLAKFWGPDDALVSMDNFDPEAE